MDTSELLETARTGQMDRLKYLIETKEVNPNVRDNWDATPLYYACLCGHEEIVRYLVERGARCEANTFDGERCLYAALTPAIRSILKEANLITSKTMRRHNFEEFMRQTLESRNEFADIRFDVHGESVLAHRCVLYARSRFFAEKLTNKWQFKSVVRLNNHRLVPAAFKAYVEFLYTGVLNVALDRLDEFVELLETVDERALVEEIEKRVKKFETYKKLKRGKYFGQFLAVEMPDTQRLLCNDLAVLATAALPKDLCFWTNDCELPFMEERPAFAPFADVCFHVDGHAFYGHRAFFCGRSEFFRALTRDHFQESDAIAYSPDDKNGESFSPINVKESTDLQQDLHFPTPPSSNPTMNPFEGSTPSYDTNVRTIPLLRLHSVSHKVFKQIVDYVYTNECQLEGETVYEVIEAADQFLLPGLKTLCGAFVADRLDVDNVISVLEMARLFSLPRLEDACYAFVAEHLESLSDSPQLRHLIRRDAAEVKNRDVEGDSIHIVDEIRFHISNNVQSWSEMDQAHERMAVVQRLMDEMNFDGCWQRKSTPVEKRVVGPEKPELWEPEFMLELPQDDDLME